MNAIEKYTLENKGALALLGVFAATSAIYLNVADPSQSVRQIQFLFLLLFLFALAYSAIQSLIWSHKNDTILNSLFSITFLLASLEVAKLLYNDYSGLLHGYLSQPVILIIILLGISQRIIGWYNRLSFDSLFGKCFETLLTPLVLYATFLLQRIYILFAKGQAIEWLIVRDVFSDTIVYLGVVFALAIIVALQSRLRKVVGLPLIVISILVAIVASIYNLAGAVASLI